MSIDVSVVVPCRNECERLAACLDALADQDLPRSRMEVIVVDAGSEDGSGALARGRGVRVLEDGGKGPGAARNIGIGAARGRIVAFTDADCVPRFDWLATFVAAFERDPDAAAFAGALRLPRSTLIGRLEDNDARASYAGYITSNIAYRRDVLLLAGGFHEEIPCAEDYDLAWRILDLGFRIEREPSAVVLHDPPEVHGSLAGYLRKQFWYARHDVPAHAVALRRAARARGRGVGASAAFGGFLDALTLSSFALAGASSLALRAPWVAAGAFGAAAISGARSVARALAEVGEGADELARLTAVDVAKRFVRGTGTLVGLADLARPRGRCALREAPSDEAAAWARASPPPAQSAA